ncbi:hypothetical protein LTR78_010602 [Recurvomyces mirabilis]|uniref:Uncharacterized protein n=1 Tax=Recurvomyces mirabilis TaxID=574656 RepID=A0AAE0WF01_9PEZI|nr:hypothetical protein LTR78_010602 [Recurvomyces mirabilis]KAK5160184.1 hypothetical protein LTS14_002291 [Recurvomyces mirabilis]
MPQATRRLREAGLPLNYGQNTFCLTDSILRSGKKADWIDLAGPDLKHIQRIKVHHRRRDFGFDGEQPSPSYHETAKFTIMRTSDGHLNLQDLSIIPDKICSCAIEDLAVKHRQKIGETALCNPVVAMMAEYAHLVKPGRVRTATVQCAQCKKLKNIQRSCS